MDIIIFSTYSNYRPFDIDTRLRLKGTKNYEIWSLRIRSLLTKEACADFLKLEGDDESTSKKAENTLAILRLVYDDKLLL